MTLADVAGKSLNAPENQAARAFAQQLVDERFDGNVSKAAAAIGVSQSFLYEFLGERRGAGMKLLRGLQDLTGVPIEQITGRVERLATFPLPNGVFASETRYPNREAAIRFLVSTAAGTEEEVEEAARRATIAAASDDDLEGEEWLAMIRAALRRMRRGEDEPGVAIALDETDPANAETTARFQRARKKR